LKNKIISSFIFAFMVAGISSFSAFAAMPNGTVTIGGKAFNLGYANGLANIDEITNAIVAGGEIYVKGFSGQWINNATGLTVTASVIPAVVYTNANGVKTSFDAKDADSSTPTIPVPDITKDSFGYDVAKEIADSKYKGRLAGTEAYKASATYVSSVFQKLGLTPSGDANTYLQKYNMNVAEYASIPTLKINGTNLTFLKDFKLHGNTSSGTINSDQVIFAGNGYEEDFTNIDVTGKTVLFLADVKTSKSVGALDRASIAKAKGATSVLIIPNIYMPINTFEKPIKYNGSNFPICYITRETAKNYVGINIDTDKIGLISKVKVEGTIDITRTPNKDSYNVLGTVKGIDQTKTIVISASLDSFGSLPDGRTANGASANAAPVGTLCDLAKYYTNTKPECNILFAVFGSQAELMEGSNYFVNNYSGITRVIADIDVYDIGNPQVGNNKIFNVVDSKYTELHTAISKGQEYVLDTPSEVNYPFGNNYQFFIKGIPNVFLRYGENLDSLNDNIIQPVAMTKVKNHIVNIITNLVPKQTPIDPTTPTKEYVASINETLNVIETKFTKLYYEDNFTQAAKLAVPQIDTIYESVLRWNYNPIVPNEKLIIYCVDDWDEGWIVTNRLDKKGLGEHSGGYQSFTDYSLSIVRLEEQTSPNEIYGTFAHEFNHVAANHALSGNDSMSDMDNQEISGHVYPFSVGMSLDGDLKSVFKSLVSDLASGNDVTKIDWTEYTGDNNQQLTNQDQWQIHYDRLASVEYYIWRTYGEELCREIQYEFYKKPRPSVQSVLESKLGKDFNTILKEWYAFYQ